MPQIIALEDFLIRLEDSTAKIDGYLHRLILDHIAILKEQFKNRRESENALMGLNETLQDVSEQQTQYEIDNATTHTKKLIKRSLDNEELLASERRRIDKTIFIILDQFIRAIQKEAASIKEEKHLAEKSNEYKEQIEYKIHLAKHLAVFLGLNDIETKITAKNVDNFLDKKILAAGLAQNFAMANANEARKSLSQALQASYRACLKKEFLAKDDLFADVSANMASLNINQELTFPDVEFEPHKKYQQDIEAFYKNKYELIRNTFIDVKTASHKSYWKDALGYITGFFVVQSRDKKSIDIDLHDMMAVLMESQGSTTLDASIAFKQMYDTFFVKTAADETNHAEKLHNFVEAWLKTIAEMESKRFDKVEKEKSAFAKAANRLAESVNSTLRLGKIKEKNGKQVSLTLMTRKGEILDPELTLTHDVLKIEDENVKKSIDRKNKIWLLRLSRLLIVPLIAVGSGLLTVGATMSLPFTVPFWGLLLIGVCGTIANYKLFGMFMEKFLTKGITKGFFTEEGYFGKLSKPAIFLLSLAMIGLPTVVGFATVVAAVTAFPVSIPIAIFAGMTAAASFFVYLPVTFYSLVGAKKEVRNALEQCRLAIVGEKKFWDKGFTTKLGQIFRAGLLAVAFVTVFLPVTALVILANITTVMGFNVAAKTSINTFVGAFGASAIVATKIARACSLVLTVLASPGAIMFGLNATVNLFKVALEAIRGVCKSVYQGVCNLGRQLLNKIKGIDTSKGASLEADIVGSKDNLLDKPKKFSIDQENATYLGSKNAKASLKEIVEENAKHNPWGTYGKFFRLLERIGTYFVLIINGIGNGILAAVGAKDGILAHQGFDVKKVAELSGGAGTMNSVACCALGANDGYRKQMNADSNVFLRGWKVQQPRFFKEADAEHKDRGLEPDIVDAAARKLSI